MKFRVEKIATVINGHKFRLLSVKENDTKMYVHLELFHAAKCMALAIIKSKFQCKKFCVYMCIYKKL